MPGPVPRPWIGTPGIQARNTLIVVLKSVKLIVFLFANLQSAYPTLELKRPRNGGLRCLSFAARSPASGTAPQLLLPRQPVDFHHL